jgi:hypothetical protein
MATNKILQEYGTQLIFADHATDFVYPATDPLAANNITLSTNTEVQMNMSVIANGAYWQSAKTATLVDTGTAWPIEWTFGACFEHAATPAAGTNMTLWWNPSPNSTAANGNSGGCSGSDAAYTAAGTNQLMLIGTMILRNNVTNINANIGTIVMPYIYGSLVVQNNSGVAMVADGDADNIYVVATPRITHIQAAA